MLPPSPSLLVAEDDVGLRQIYREYLGEEGFQISEAGTTAEVRQILEKQNFDLLILDLGLPGEDGLSLLREIRRTSTLPIIIVSGKNDPL